MMGARIKKAKEALILFIRSLPEGAKYAIISFGSRFEFMKTRNNTNIFTCGEDANYQVINFI